MTYTPPPEQLTHIVASVRYQTLQIRSANSCIASTRILTEVLRYFGYASEPLPCTTLVFNAAGYDYATREVPTDQWPIEAHSVGAVGSGRYRPETNAWDGHLVAIVDGRWLADPSLDQFARPQRGINVDPVVLDISDWHDRSRANHWQREDGVVIAYQAMRNPGPWRNAPDWSGKGNMRLFKPAIAAAIRYVRQAAA